MRDERIFPLLGDTRTPYLADGLSYPRCFSFGDGSLAPLFTNGVVTIGELEGIARATATRLAELYAGRRLLIIQVLEGGRPFAAMVIRHLETMRALHDLCFEAATVQVRSYGQGSQAAAHRVLQPMCNHLGQELEDCSDFEGVVLVDDMIDAGHTVVWLVRDYLPRFGIGAAGVGREVKVCTMLDKIRPRDEVVEEVLAGCMLSSGLTVPDEWLVGYGLDTALPGAGDRPSLHLFRQALPGGIYAFNSAIEQRLIAAYEADPAEVCRQLAIYLSPA